MIYMVAGLFLVMIAVAVSLIFVKDTVGVVIVGSVVSLVASILFVFMSAPDVAITEASIGAALTLIVFLIAIARTVGKER